MLLGRVERVPSEASNKLYTILDDLRADLSGNDILDECGGSTGELVKAVPALDKSLSELLYGYYSTGGFYHRHTDSVVGSASVLRSYSLLLLYLNNEWKESDGGRLRVLLDSGKDFLPDGEEPNFIDVEGQKEARLFCLKVTISLTKFWIHRRKGWQ